MEYYPVIKKNEIMVFVGKWMKLENIMLSKVSQAQKVKDHMFSLCGSWNYKINIYINIYIHIKSYVCVYHGVVFVLDSVYVLYYIY
jgi:hypothetical protein